MKTPFNFLLYVFIIFGFSKASAQDSNQNPFDLINNQKLLDTNFDNLKSKNSAILSANSIQISQVGLNNYTDVYLKSSNAKLLISQEGVNNYVEVYKNVKQLQQSIFQNGDNNFISDTSAYSGNSVDMMLSQEGSNLMLFNTGSNSISKDLKISQKGNSGTIYVFNR